MCLFLKIVSPSKVVVCFILNNLHFLIYCITRRHTMLQKSQGGNFNVNYFWLKSHCKTEDLLFSCSEKIKPQTYPKVSNHRSWGDALLIQRIDTYIIAYYIPSVRIIDLVSQSNFLNQRILVQNRHRLEHYMYILCISRRNTLKLHGINELFFLNKLCLETRQENGLLK